MANNPDKPQSYHEVPASKYWYLGDVIGAVPKAFFKVFTPAIIILTATVTTIANLTNWWWLLGSAILQFIFIRFWYIGWPAIILSVGGGYIYYRVKQTEKRKAQEQKVIDDRVRKGLQRIGQEEVM